MSTKKLSEACRRYLAARWDDGYDADDDSRFDEYKAKTGSQNLSVIELEVKDMQEYPELRSLTAVAISQDGETYYTTDEDLEDDE